jgi:Flp pilus assembly protein protease CpaA
MPAMFNLPLSFQWPLWVGVAVVIAAAVQNHFTNRVSNLLTLGAIGAGWLAAHLLSALGAGPLVGGNLASSLGCTFAALGLLVPFYAANLAPAGSIKAQMGLGAWIGCAVPLGPALVLTVSATIVGGIVTAIGVYFYYRKQRAVLETDPWGLDGPSYLFPFQLTLSLGSLCGMLGAVCLGFV